jgi:hypothetical protein
MKTVSPMEMTAQKIVTRLREHGSIACRAKEKPC